MRPIYEDHPLRRFFRGLVENVFSSELGLCSPGLTAYLTDLLTNFVHIDRLRAIHDTGGRPLDQIAEMLALVVGPEAADGTGSDRTCIIYRHIGDYTLFWVGVYPERLRCRRRANKPDRLLDYVEQGKRSYAIASELTDPGAVPPPRLLRELSEEFESCAHGLELVRREWEHELDDPPGQPPPILL
jgi:hypothetical protein